MKRILVTGAAGRVGEFVVPELLEHGYLVRGLDNREIPHEGIDRTTGDIRDFEAVYEATEGMDAIIHLAAIAGDTLAMPELFPINVAGVVHVLEAASRRGGTRVVLASSIQVYGFQSQQAPLEPERLPVTESHPVAPSHGYGMTKAAAEALARGYARRPGHSVIVLRPGGVLDFEAGGVRHAWAPLDAGVHGPDAATAFRLALETDRSWGVYNLVSARRYDPDTGEPISPARWQEQLRSAGISESWCDGRLWNAETNVYCIDRVVEDMGYRPMW